MDYPVVYTITAESDTRCRLYTKDSRISEKDRCVGPVVTSKLLNTMIMISSVLNDEGFAVIFEVD